MITWWKLDDSIGTSVSDSSGNSKTGTLNGANGLPVWVSGKRGGALSFDGTDDYVNFSTINGFGTLVSQGDFTVSLWTKTNLTNTRQIIFGDHSSFGTSSSFLIEYGGYLQDQSHVTTFIAGGYLDSNFVYSANTWYHIVVTRTASTRSIYINGTLQHSDSNITINPGTKLAFGRSGDYDSSYVNGFIDDIRIYNRALSAAEVLAIYNLPTKSSMGGGTHVGGGHIGGQ